MWNQTVPFFKRTKILGTAFEFGLSLIYLALSECMSHLGLNTNIQHKKICTTYNVKNSRLAARKTKTNSIITI